LTTPNRRRFLLKQIEENSGYKYIIVSRDASELYDISGVVKLSNGRLFGVDRISFKELALFIQRAFQMEGPKAEVLANRLNTIFSRFDLFAHPSYLAGIPEQLLASLLQANRRSELVQLAVVGYLSFLVASDESNVTLSRTTRSLFLQKLVYDIRVEKLSITKVELVERARFLSEEMDFGIDPVRFVEDFFDRGILSTKSDRIEFALPFIERYLLANELAGRPDRAIVYFDFGNPDFDVATFDLYCEMATENSCIEALHSKINECVEGLKRVYDGSHVSSLDLRPEFAFKANRLEAMGSKLKQAAEDIASGKSNIEQKQALIDLVEDGISKTQKRKSNILEDASSDDSEGKTTASEEDTNNLKGNAMHALFLSAIALSAGAERFDASQKQELVASILSLGSIIVHGWLTDASTIKASDILQDLKKSPVYEEMRKGATTAEKEKSLESLVDQLSKYLEFLFLAEPISIVLHVLTEYGRNKILSVSIERAAMDEGFARVLRGIWLSDLDVNAGVRSLSAQLKSTNLSDFFRIVFVEHILTRVHWDHWNPTDRIKLLNYAVDLLKPTTMTLRKGEIEREIKREAKKKKDEKEEKPRDE
jgi:hypothetical protein